MKRLLRAATSRALVVGTVGLVVSLGSARAAETISTHDSRTLPRTLLVSHDHDDDDDDHARTIHWSSGTITHWDPGSKTFVLREEEGRGKKRRVVTTTFAWNEKTTVEGTEARVGQRAKVKFTRKKDGRSLARHVFIGKRAIQAHKAEASTRD